jgi:hypothetical protein
VSHHAELGNERLNRLIRAWFFPLLVCGRLSESANQFAFCAAHDGESCIDQDRH